MIDRDYEIWARLFDAVLEANAIDGRVGIQLHGDGAGAALRTWAARRRLDAVPRTMDAKTCPEVGSWTAIDVALPNGACQSITVHLDDNLRLTAPAPADAPSDGPDIPF